MRFDNRDTEVFMYLVKTFVADKRKLFKIGVSFDSDKRMLAEWKVVEE